MKGHEGWQSNFCPSFVAFFYLGKNYAIEKKFFKDKPAGRTWDVIFPAFRDSFFLYPVREL
jgi:hypothetical protein